MNAPSVGHPLADLFIYTAGVLLALGTVYRYVWPVVRGVWRVGRGVEEFATDWRATGGLRGLSQQMTDVKGLATQTHKELHPNGGGSMRDAIDQAAKEARHAVDAAKVAAEGVVRIEKATELNRVGINEITEELHEQGRRITNHRSRNDATIKALEDYIHGERQDFIEAKQGLEASVTELLHLPESPPSEEPS